MALESELRYVFPISGRNISVYVSAIVEEKYYGAESVNDISDRIFVLNVKNGENR